MAIEQELVSELLSEIVKSKPDIQPSDHKWLIGLLKDLYNPKREIQHSDCIKEINGLANCLFWGIVDEIKSNYGITIDPTEAKTILRQLINNYGLQEDLSRWCIETWCRVLNKKIDWNSIERVYNYNNQTSHSGSGQTSGGFSEKIFHDIVVETLQTKVFDTNTKFELTVKARQLGLNDNQIETVINHTLEHAKSDQSILGFNHSSTPIINVDVSNWCMFGHNPQHTRRSPFKGPKTSILKWMFKVVDSISSSPAIGQDGSIYIGSDNILYNISRNGRLIWKYEVRDSIASTPAVANDGTIYFGSKDNKLYALNHNGKFKWQFKADDFISSSPVIGADGTIYFGSYDCNLYALYPDGRLKWKYKTHGWIDSSPAIGLDGSIYIGSYDKHLYAIKPDGTLNWSVKTKGSISSSPAVGQKGSIYFGCDDKKLYAVNISGKLRWTFETLDIINGSPAIDIDGTIFIGSGDKNIYAINPDGKLSWQLETGDQIWSSPAIDIDGIVYISSNDGNLYAINLDGKIKWTYETGGGDSSPAIGNDGTIYVGSADKNLYAIGPGEGK